MWNDLTDEAERLNAICQNLRAPLMCKAGPRALQWFKVYQGETTYGSGYSIARSEARKILAAFGYDIDGLPLPSNYGKARTIY